MAIFENAKVMNGGLTYLKTNCNSVCLIDKATYVAGDSYASVRGTSDANVIVERTIVSTDIVLADQGTLGRKATITTTSSPTLPAIADSSGDAGGLFWAALDTVNSDVLIVFDCTRDSIILTGDPITMQELIIKRNQPTIV